MEAVFQAGEAARNMFTVSFDVSQIDVCNNMVSSGVSMDVLKLNLCYHRIP